ncbi:MAG: succinate dehydrogenase, cytochrome b556 subunit [Candidatus Krumholzibacteriota bacterium]|nr:succinate dehydrogenase, cytochrome b556 subunit [Candidatus Krumholzibacteriota bacterium]
MRVIKRYRIHAGTFAWILHRLSGLGLIFYLLLHIWVISHLSGGEKSFDGIMHAFGNPLFKLLEVGLVGVILYHLFNGLRITLVDMGILIERQKMLYLIAVIIWLVSWAAIGAVMVTRMVLPALG